MKKSIFYIAAFVMVFGFTRCDDWTETEGKFSEPVNVNTEAYYQALRDYKKSDHPIVFGWYSDWTGLGTDMLGQLRGIPDSMDMVSIWGGAFDLTPAKLSDRKEVREKKGTRLLYCQHITDLGTYITPSSVSSDYVVNGTQYGTYDEAMAAYWGWYGSYGDTSDEGIEKAIRKYARSLADTIIKLDYDGCDIDYEPNYGHTGNIASYPARMHYFLGELSKYFGPASGTGRILAVDGEPQTLLAESGPLLNYYIIQAYYNTGDLVGSNSLDNRFQKLLNKFGSLEDEATILKKTIWCEDFERHKSDGGPVFTTRDGVVTYSLMGMAMYYRPGVDSRIGGVGAYRFNLCRPVNDYYFMREVIQQLNPASK